MQVPQSISDIRLLSSKRNGASKRSDIRTYEFAEHLRPGTRNFHISRFDCPTFQMMLTAEDSYVNDSES